MTALRTSAVRMALALCCAIGTSLAAACNNAAPPTDAMSPAENASEATAQTAMGAAGQGSGNTSEAGSDARGSSSPMSQGGSGAPATGLGTPATEQGGAPASAGSAASGGVAADSDAGAPMASAMGGRGDVSDETGAAGDTGVQPSEAKPPCLKQASQLIAVGDSYLNWITHNFPDDFKQAFGGEYRMYAVGGASMASGGISGFIPDQLSLAVSEDPDIIAAVITGGGNDILIADTIMYPGSDTCKDRTDADTLQVCKDVIQNAMDAAAKLMVTSADAGIKDAVYIYYPQIPGGGFGGMNPNVILAYSLPLARELCAQAEATTEGRLRCHFLDLQPVFDDHPDWFADDGIHENELGSAAMADAVVQLLKDKCIAQPEASGCCAP